MLGLMINLLWVPGHYVLKGNEMADRTAKKAVRNSLVDFVVKFSKTEIKYLITQPMKDKWKKQWEKAKKGRWFYKIQQKTGEMRNRGRTRREETIISCLRFGHIGLKITLFYFRETSMWENCGVDEIIESM